MSSWSSIFLFCGLTRILLSLTLFVLMTCGGVEFRRSTILQWIPSEKKLDQERADHWRQANNAKSDQAQTQSASRQQATGHQGTFHVKSPSEVQTRSSMCSTFFLPLGNAFFTKLSSLGPQSWPRSHVLSSEYAQ